MSKKRKLIGGILRCGLGLPPTSTFPLEDNPVDSIIRDLEGVRYRIAEYDPQI